MAKRIKTLEAPPGLNEHVLDDRAAGAGDQVENMGRPNKVVRPKPAPAPPADPIELAMDAYLRNLNTDLHSKDRLPTLAERIAAEGAEAQLGAKPSKTLRRPKK
jgi:hypothetical protein